MTNKKLLLIRTSALGDVIFTIPLANCLKNNGYSISWLVGEKGINVVKYNNCVDECIYVPIQKWGKQNFIKSFIEYIKLIKYIRKQKFDIAIDTQGLLFKSGIFLLFSGAKRRIICNNAREFAFLCGNEIIDKSLFENEQNFVKKNLKYANYLGLNENSLKYSLPSPSIELQKKVEKLLEGIDKSKPIVTICPATTWIGKHWDKDNWKNLVAKLEKEYTLIFTGTKKDSELIEYISGGNGLNLAGKTNLLELAEIFRHSMLVISLDSGSTHLARATETPKIVSIFCCTPPEMYAPLGSEEKYIAIVNKNCKPCKKNRCKLKDEKYKCTTSPSVEEVLQAVENILKEDQ